MSGRLLAGLALAGLLPVLRCAAQGNMYAVRGFTLPANITQPFRTGLQVQPNDYVYFDVVGRIDLGPTLGSSNGDGLHGIAGAGGIAYNKYDGTHGALICLVGDASHSYSAIKAFQPAPLVPEPTAHVYWDVADADRRSQDGDGPYIAGRYFLATNAGELLFDINDTEPQNNAGSYEVNVFVLPRSSHTDRNLFNSCPKRQPGDCVDLQSGHCAPVQQCEDCHQGIWNREDRTCSIFYHGMNTMYRGAGDLAGCQCAYEWTTGELLNAGDHQGSFDYGLANAPPGPGSAKYKHLVLDMVPHDLYASSGLGNAYQPSPVHCLSDKENSLFLIDVSGSMNENGKIGQAKQAARSTIATIRSEAAQNGTVPEIGLMTFSGACVPDPTSMVLPFTTRLDQALTSVDRIPAPSGATPLPQAIVVARAALEQRLAANGQSCGSLVILSDGQSTCGDIRPPGTYAGLPIAVNVCGNVPAGAFRLKHYTVGLAIPPGSPAERDLQYLAASTGGKYFQAKNEQELTRAFQKISRKYVPKRAPLATGIDAAGLFLFGMGLSFIATEQYDSALVRFSRYTALFPTDAAGVYDLALMQEANDRYRFAGAGYQRYLDLVPDAADKAVVQERITRLRTEHAEFQAYMKEYLQSDTAYFQHYFKKLQGSGQGQVMEQEFAGFLAEKGPWYKKLPDLLETDDAQVKRYSKETAQAFERADILLRKSQNWGIDGVAAVAGIHEPLKRLMARVLQSP